MLHIAQCLDNGMIVVTALVPHPVAPYSRIGFSLESDTREVDHSCYVSWEVLTRFTRSSARAVWLAKAISILSCS